MFLPMHLSLRHRPRRRPPQRPAFRLAGLLGALAVAGLLGSACRRAEGAAAPDTDARRAIEHAVAEYVDATNRGDAGALAELYAEDAVLLPPSDTLVRGREAIRTFWSHGIEGGLHLETVRLDVHGDAAFFVGRYQLDPTPDASADSGKCAMTFTRGRDGRWKLTTDIWNNDAPAESSDGTLDDAPIAPIT
jgi:uncharacterized protein (TIGR02246 family)